MKLVKLIRVVFALSAILMVAPVIFSSSAIGQSHVTRGGTVGIQNATERDLFFSLICMCGCPRETLGTCTCDYANERRGELREMLGDGLSIQAVQKAYAGRFGTESLAVPPSRGLSGLIYGGPILAFILGAFGLSRLLRRWSTAKPSAAGATPAETPSDEAAYDARLDQELKELDRE